MSYVLVRLKYEVTKEGRCANLWILVLGVAEGEVFRRGANA